MTKCDNKSAGVVVKNADNEILLIERKKHPFGFAPPAGHIDDHGSYEKAAIEEVKEETGLNVKSLLLIFEVKKNFACRREGGSWHYWKVYEAEDWEGDIRGSRDETKSAGWYSKDKILKMMERTKKYISGEITDKEWERRPGIERVWYELFQESGILTKDASKQ